MASQILEINWAVKTGSPSLEEGLMRVGGIDSNDKPWSLTISEVIDALAQGNVFYCLVDGWPEKVVAASGSSGKKYIRCVLDRSPPNHLLELPSSPPKSILLQTGTTAPNPAVGAQCSVPFRPPF
jgi:hypothetical protein